MMRAKKSLWVLIPLLFYGCSPAEYPDREDHNFIPFRMTASSIPMVKIRLNDKDAWFIVDTGASATVINKALTKHFGISDYANFYEGETEINGLGGAVAFRSAKCRIGIGKLTIYHSVLKSPDLNALFSFIGNRESVEIAGILGSDILSRYRLNINYETMTISYRFRDGLRDVLRAIVNVGQP